jgi:quinol monooxygenase YgiN
MVITLLRVVVPTDKQEAVLEILSSVIDLTWGLPGCTGCVCYEEPKKDGAVLYMEQWESKEDLYRHIQSDLYLRLISVMEMAAEAPEIRFHEVSKTMGMELIETLRTDLRIPNVLPEHEAETLLGQRASLIEKRAVKPAITDPFQQE